MHGPNQTTEGARDNKTLFSLLATEMDKVRLLEHPCGKVFFLRRLE